MERSFLNLANATVSAAIDCGTRCGVGEPVPDALQPRDNLATLEAAAVELSATVWRARWSGRAAERAQINRPWSDGK